MVVGSSDGALDEIPRATPPHARTEQSLEEYTPLYESVSNVKAKTFLEAWMLTGSARNAEDLTGISRTNHPRWMGRKVPPALPGYVAAFEEVWEYLQLEADHETRERALNGYEEARYDADGNLLFKRIRHDSGLWKMYMQRMRPETYGHEKHGGQVINVVFPRVWECPLGEISAELVERAESEREVREMLCRLWKANYWPPGLPPPPGVPIEEAEFEVLDEGDGAV
ncbi:hypothetical protein ACGF5M_03085 [Gemmatimonadota bacterium]